jgi:hypothetical protein
MTPRPTHHRFRRIAAILITTVALGACSNAAHDSATVTTAPADAPTTTTFDADATDPGPGESDPDDASSESEFDPADEPSTTEAASGTPDDGTDDSSGADSGADSDDPSIDDESPDEDAAIPDPGDPEAEQYGPAPVQPTHETPPPPPPSWNGVTLSPVAKTAPAPELVAPPAPVPVPVFGGIDDLTSNAVGCAATCIVEALLHHQQIAADLDLTIETNVAGTVRVWISKQPPVMIGGVPVFPGKQPIVSPAGVTSWATTLGGLSYDTQYHVIVRVDDQYGNKEYATTPVTTRSAPGGGALVGNATGCQLQCITRAEVVSSNDYSVVALMVDTNVPAEIRVAISTSEPGWVGENPLLPEDEVFTVASTTPQGIVGSASGLDPDTTYHVVVKATDANGSYAWAVGQFHTDPLPPRVVTPTDVYVEFERIELLHDGDPSWKNRGEIGLVWGFFDPYDVVGSRPYDKMSDGDSYTVPDGHGRWFSLEPGDRIPDINVTAHEFDLALDGDGGDCLSGETLADAPHVDDPCDTTVNPAEFNGATLESLSGLAPCIAYGLTGPAANDRCARFESPEMGDSFARIAVIVRFHIA